MTWCAAARIKRWRTVDTKVEQDNLTKTLDRAIDFVTHLNMLSALNRRYDRQTVTLH